MAAPRTPEKSDKSSFEDNSILNVSDTVYLSSSEDDYLGNSTVNISSSEASSFADISLGNNSTRVVPSSATKISVAGSPSSLTPGVLGDVNNILNLTPTSNPPGVFEFVGVEQTGGNNDNNKEEYHIEFPSKRHHSPDRIKDQSKRKCETLETFTAMSQANESTANFLSKMAPGNLRKRNKNLNREHKGNLHHNNMRNGTSDSVLSGALAAPSSDPLENSNQTSTDQPSSVARPDTSLEQSSVMPESSADIAPDTRESPLGFPDEVKEMSTLETSLTEGAVGGSPSVITLPGDDMLPPTVTKLETPSGSVVYLVGTAHFSVESQEDVSMMIQMVRPHVVTVELCKSRITLLQLDEQTILREAQDLNFAKMRATIMESGLFNGIMYLMLLSMSAHLTKQLGMAPGGEFRRAMLEAGRIPGCCIHLGDRPIKVTVQRALSSLTWWQTIKLSWHILTSREPISKEEVEKCKQRDLLEEMLKEMAGEFPALSRVFVKERDLYLAHSLALAAQPMPNQNTGLLEPGRVVGVVGIGHVEGIVNNWGKVSEEDIEEIIKIPPPTLSSKIFKFTVKAGAIGLVVWASYKILPVPRIKLWKAMK